MKEGKSLLCRLLSLAVIVLMLSAMMILPASAVYTYPDSGIIINEDYEGYADGDGYVVQKDGYHFSRGGIKIKDFNGNKVWDVNASSNPGNPNVHQAIELNNCTANDAGGIAQVDTGKLVMEYDLYFPTPAAGKQMTAGQRVGHYIANYASDYSSSAVNEKRAFLVYSQMVTNASGTGHVAQIKFPENNIGAPQTDFNPSATTLSLDTWHHIVHYIDYDKNEMLHYVDGDFVAVSTDDIAENAPFYQTYIYTQATSGTTADFANYIDNFQITRLTGKESFDITVKNVGADYIELETNQAINFSNLSVSDFNLKVFNGSTVGAPSSLSYFDKTLRLNYPSLVKGSSYELYLNKAMPSVINPSLAIPAGTKLAVSTGNAEKVLLDQDFSDLTWATEEGQNTWSSYVQSYLPADSGAADASYTNALGKYRFQESDLAYKYVYPVYKTGTTDIAMALSKTWPETIDAGSSTVYLPFSEPASSGVLTVEFDILAASSLYPRFAVGLRDTENVATEFNPWTSWADATMFGGYTTWGTGYVNAVGGQRNVRAAAPDLYLLKDDPTASGFDKNPNNNYLTDSEMSSREDFLWGASTGSVKGNMARSSGRAANSVNTATISTIALSNPPVSGAAYLGWKTWRFVIDLDNNTYDFYQDDILQKSFDYIPGGEAGTYDAFAATVCTFSNATATSMNIAEASLFIDNVKVSQSASAPILTGATFVKHDGTQSGLSAIMSAGTRQIELLFSEPMDSSSFSNITMPGASFTCKPEGSKVILDLPNCLSPDTPYTLTIGKNLMGSSGVALGVDTVIEFTTDIGELQIKNPVLKSNDNRVNMASSINLGDSLTAELEIINTIGAEQDAFLLVASYKGGMLASAFTGELAPTQNSAKLEARFTADEGFVNADTIKMFVLNNSEDIQPLLNPVEIRGGNAAEVSLSSANGEGLFITASVPSGLAPNVVTKGGRSGWQINPGVLRESYISFDLDDAFMHDMKPEDTATILVDYYDEEYNGFGILYDDRNGAADLKFQYTNPTSTWKTTSIDIYGAKFKNSTLLNQDDFRIIVNDEEFATDKKKLMGEATDPAVIGNVAVIKNSTKAPFEIVENTPHAGNVFFTGEALTFDIDYNDISSTGGYTEADVSYTVYNHSGAKVWETTSQIVNNKDAITVPAQPYGVYTLELEITGGNILQKEIIDFSYSMYAPESNMKFGTNVHFDWYEALTTDDVDDILELVKASGYGFVRTKVDWQDVQPTKGGAYQPNELYWYGNQKTDELGMELIALISQGNGAYDNSPFLLDSDELRQAYADACTYIVSELKQYTDYYMNPNEQNNFNVSPEYYAKYSIAANNAIHAEHPGAKVISGSVGYLDSYNWAQGVFDNGLLASTEGFSYHHYDYKGESERYSWPSFEQMADLLHSYDANQEFWITENGWPTLNGIPGAEYDYWVETEVGQAIYSARSFGFYAGLDKVEKYFHYCFPNSNVGYFWTEDNFGIVRSHDYRTPFAAKPAFVTTAAYNTIVGTATPLGDQETSESLYVYKFENKASEEVYMLWHDRFQGDQTYSFATDKAKLEIYDMYGNKNVVDVSGGSYDLWVTGSPIYVKAIN